MSRSWVFQVEWWCWKEEGRAGRNKKEREDAREGEVKTAVITSSSVMGLAQHDETSSR